MFARPTMRATKPTAPTSPEVPHRPRRNSVSLAALTTLLVGAAGAAQAADLLAARIATPGPIVALDGKAWEAAPVTVAMQPQQLLTPMNANPAVKQLQVRAVHNGQWLAVLIEWADPTQSDVVSEERFDDKVAVELPIKYDPANLPSPMMGHPGGRVNIVQWRAAFQRDLADGGPSIAKLYPNAADDLYPDAVLRASDARPYSGAAGLRNPISRPGSPPILDQIAEGGGTLTVKPDMRGDGAGKWTSGRWRVAISLPMANGVPNAPELTPGAETALALAVWDGGSKEAGSRKSWSNWVTVKLAP